MVSDQMSVLCEAVPDCPAPAAERTIPFSRVVGLGAGLCQTLHCIGL